MIEIAPNVTERLFPLGEASVMDLSDGECDVPPELKAAPTPGHTTGHISISSRGGRGFVIGEVDRDPPSIASALMALYLPARMADQPILVLEKEAGTVAGCSVASAHGAHGGSGPAVGAGTVPERVRAIRSRSHQSWSNIRKAARSLQGLEHEPFGTPNVESSSKSCVRKICSEEGPSYAEVEALLDERGWG